jgi:hypothetical protein
MGNLRVAESENTLVFKFCGHKIVPTMDQIYNDFPRASSVSPIFPRPDKHCTFFS